MTRRAGGTSGPPGVVPVFLADLAHTRTVRPASLTVPLNIGGIKAHALRRHGGRVRIELFRDPESLMERAGRIKPGMIGFASYSWNERLNLEVGRHLRRHLPRSLFVSGGPNLDGDPEDRLAYLERNDHLDLVVTGAGEEPFGDLVGWWLGHGADRYCREGLPGNVLWRSGARLGATPERPVARDAGSLVSPYLSGALDEFLAAGMVPMFETNRGCPFRCTFCAWGAASRSAVTRRDLAAVLAEFEYVAARSRAENWIVCDANFGLLPRDVEIARALRAIKDRTGFPRKVHLWLSKRATGRNVEIASILREMAFPAMSVQSLDAGVLRRVRRVNLPLATYAKYLGLYAGLGLDTMSETIVPLPGETLASHRAGLRRLFELDVPIVINHNLRLLRGTELAGRRSRRRHGLRTRFRLIHGDAGVYRGVDGTPVRAFEYEESVRRTLAMSEEDLFYLRRLHFLVEFCWNLKVYRPCFRFAARRGVNPLDVLETFLRVAARPAAGPAGARVAGLLRDFEADSRAEWFDTRERIEAHFGREENFARLERLEYDKLNILYSVAVLRDCKAQFDAVFSRALRRACRSRGGKGLEAAERLAFGLFPGLGHPSREEGLALELPRNLPELLRPGAGAYRPSPETVSVELHEDRHSRELRELLGGLEGSTLSKALNLRGMAALTLRDLQLRVRGPGYAGLLTRFADPAAPAE